ncbi:MAG: zf-HC2 domain-containing protein [Bacteroidetes bacterium]|nr:zf-HC2 domain-containing protein [Bacteroidota bacterium]
MRCDDVAVNLPDYVLGKIEPNLKRSVEYHLEICSKCKAELENIREPIRLLGEIEVEEYPDTFWQELHSVIMERVSAEKPARWRVPAFAAGLAVILLVVGVGVYEYAVRTVPQAASVSALATSLSSDQALNLPSMNINYVNAVSYQAKMTDEIGAVDDSVQEAVIKSMWASATDSTASLEDFYYTGNAIVN